MITRPKRVAVPHAIRFRSIFSPQAEGDGRLMSPRREALAVLAERPLNNPDQTDEQRLAQSRVPRFRVYRPITAGKIRRAGTASAEESHSGLGIRPDGKNRRTGKITGVLPFASPMQRSQGTPIFTRRRLKLAMLQPFQFADVAIPLRTQPSQAQEVFQQPMSAACEYRLRVEL